LGQPPPQVVDAAMRVIVNAFNEQYHHLHATPSKPDDPLPPGAVLLPAIAPSCCPPLPRRGSDARRRTR
jgi:hypothetical protein